MNERQREYFRVKLLTWKDEILRESKITLQTLQEENVNHPDLADRASSETDRAIELRARDRQRKLISKIDAALQRIEDNTYGYCEETGDNGHYFAAFGQVIRHCGSLVGVHARNVVAHFGSSIV